ncbi:MAG: SRPBCC family protein [Crocinitomicaceae bacterium]
MAKDLLVEKSIVINLPVQEVYSFLKYATNQNHFSVWNQKDPNRKTVNTGEDGTIGFITAWDSKDKSVGAGAQEITDLIENERIEYVIRFERPMKNTAVSKFVLDDLGDNKTQVSWDFRGPTKFPMSLFKGIFQKMLGKDMGQSLSFLKQHLEI